MTSSSSAVVVPTDDAIAANIESRVAALEAKIGCPIGGISAGTTIGGTDNVAEKDYDLSARLDRLLKSYNTRTNGQFRDICTESSKLFVELNAGSMMSYQTKSTTTGAVEKSSSSSNLVEKNIATGVISSAPVYYRRQEILASAESMQNDMKLLEQMIPLLLLGTSSSSSSASNDSTSSIGSGKQQQQLREDQVINAPIVTNTSVQIPLNEQRRLDALRLNIQDLETRSGTIQQRLDRLLQVYFDLITAINNKLVLADEQLSE